MRDEAIQRIGAAVRAVRPFGRRRLRRIAACATLIAVLGATVFVPPRPRLLWNASASAPIGFWRVMPDAPVRRGDMVAARLAQPWRSLAARRHYLPANVPLLKRVAAEPGDRICAFEAWIFIEGRLAATRLRADRAGLLLPWWHGCRTLTGGELLLLMDDPASFDGRYFGPVTADAIVGKAVPLWLR